MRGGGERGWVGVRDLLCIDCAHNSPGHTHRRTGMGEGGGGRGWLGVKDLLCIDCVLNSPGPRLKGGRGVAGGGR